jgi:N,N'-diacetylchitobiose transport system permease protein
MSSTALRPARRRRELTPLFLLIPAGVVLLALTGWPLVQLIVTSLFEYGRAQIFGAPPIFVGFDNYLAVLSDSEFWQVLGRSLAFCLANVVLTMLLGVAIAVLLTKLGKGFKLLVSVGLLLAWAMPALTASVVWGWMFDSERGVINWLLTNVTGVDFVGHSWLIQPLSFFFVATIIVTWQAIPFVAFTTFAALTQVPGEVLEAAAIDGATGWQRFRHIVFPYLRGVLVIVLVLEIIWDMRVFPQIFALQTIGGIAEETRTIGIYIYNVSISSGDLGTGGAISVLLVIIMLGLSGYYIRSLLKTENDS